MKELGEWGKYTNTGQIQATFWVSHFLIPDLGHTRSAL